MWKSWPPQGPSRKLNRRFRFRQSTGNFGFYFPGSNQVALSSFAHYAKINTHSLALSS